MPKTSTASFETATFCLYKNNDLKRDTLFNLTFIFTVYLLDFLKYITYENFTEIILFVDQGRFFKRFV